LIVKTFFPAAGYEILCIDRPAVERDRSLQSGGDPCRNAGRPVNRLKAGNFGLVLPAGLQYIAPGTCRYSEYFFLAEPLPTKEMKLETPNPGGNHDRKECE
jgi:hypothetical protein